MMDYQKHPAYAMYSSRPPPPPPPPRATTTNTTAPESRIAAPPPPSPASSSRAYAPLPEAYSLQSAAFPRRDAEVPRSTLTTAATNSLYRYPPPPPTYPPENGDASGRAENARRYHVTQTGRGSVKKPPHHHPEGERRGRRAPDGAERRWGYREGCLPMNPPSSHDHARRRSLGSTGASSAFPGPPDPSVVGSRRMPPPSPPQHYPSRSQSGNAAASFLSREPPSASAAAHHRPGSSMSISAMLGSSDADRPARDGGSSSLFSRLPTSSAPFGSAPPPSTAGAMSPPTAPARPSALDYSPFRRSHTPEKSFSKPPTVKPYRSNSGGIPAPPGSESSRFGGLSRVNPSTQHPEKASSAHPSPQVSSVEPPYSEPRRLSFGAPAPRPNSQPQHVDATGRSPGYGSLTRPSAAPVSGDGPFGGRAASYMGHEGHPSRFGGLYGDRHLEEQAHRERERALAQENEAKTSHGSARFGHYGERESSSSRPPGGWEMGRSQPTSPEAKRFSAPESTGGFGFGAIQSYTKSLGSQSGGARGPLSIQPRQDQPTPPPHETPSYLSKLQADSRIYSSAPSSGSSVVHATEEQRRKGSEELLQHRNLLGVGLDAKRGGRASPLPQAVQGAQAQILGPAEAGIKSDLGRVFSGIGSGVGGVTAGSAGSGPSTPMAASPFKRDSVTARSTNSEPTTDETKIGRPTSATGKRSRKSRDEDYAETEASARGGRRSRHLHHHHHHHHHHRHKDEDVIAPHRPPSTSVFPRTTTPAEGSGVSGHPHHHHHHHHHHPHHHHHHAPRPSAPSAVAPMREPRTVVTIEPTLASVAHLPRHHLGSTLYSPIIGVPTEKASLESAKFGYTTTPRPLPRFEGKANCTFTVRVPRFRIDASHREEICARRALWGSGIYTDDSDPVAAAIHSGFLRGAWPEDVEVDMLDLEIRDAYQHAPKTAADMGLPADETRPGAPPVPPTDKDLHITLLVLPALERYDSSVLFGIKSRMWDGHHDGMSFKVQRVEWVEEGVGRGEERGGAARRKRLRNLMQSGRICTGPGVVKLDHLRNGIPISRQTPKTESSTMQTVS